MPLIVFPAILLSAATCRKSMDAPPAYNGPQISANLSVRQLRNMHFTGGFEKIMAEYVISGIVVANDSSDNFYKTIVLQDSTAGITIRLDGTGLYGSYPVGRQLFIRLKDLWLGDYAGSNDQDSILNAILHERQVELFTEWGHRWFDLIRMQKINEVMSVVTPMKGGVWSQDGYQQLFPVPQSDININNKLTQNPEYD